MRRWAAELISASLFILCFLWGGFFFILSADAPAEAAYGGNLQAERYPQRVPQAKFVALAQGEVGRILEGFGEQRRHELTLLRAPQDMRLPDGAITFEAKGRVNYAGTFPIQIRVFVDGRPYRYAVVYYKLKVYDTGLVAAHELRPNQEIAEGDVRTQEFPVRQRGTVYLKDFSALAGRVPARLIAADTPIEDVFLQQPIAIEAGHPVAILAAHHGITVKAMGTALQRGRIGATIRVRNESSGKILLGKVVDGSTVEIVS